MSVELPALPYDLDALAPHVSARTLEFHYGKHHKAYVDKLNAAIAGTDYDQIVFDTATINGIALDNNGTL